MAEFTPAEREKFDKIKEKVLKVVRIMDNEKGLNIKRYEMMFARFQANPDEFRKWEMLNNNELDSAPQMFYLPFEECKMRQIEKAAEYLECPLEEYVWYRHINKDGIRTKMRVPVGYVYVKRLQQILSKKNHYATDIDERSLKTRRFEK